LSVQILEAEKREMLEVPASELEDWQAKRTRAAMKVQAHWRGLVQRKKMAEKSPERRLKEQVRMNETGTPEYMLPQTRRKEFFSFVLAICRMFWEQYHK
jgi:hypothetical protein